ncbi:MAG TPA: hypothetical protein VIC33_09725 [Vicinamibacterales bacterium]|jgi:hypothetical protein
MRSAKIRRTVTAGLLVCAAALNAAVPAALAQAASSTTDRDQPSISGHVTLFSDYTYQSAPTATDAEGNSIHRNAFTVSRSYMTLQGTLNHMFEFRVTADSSPETGAGSALNGSYTFRIKYAFAQIDLDDWMTKGSWIRIGMHQTPFIDYYEGVYRYRFEGTTFIERNGYTASSDDGVGFHSSLPQGYGDFQVGVYNGETYKRLEANNQKSFEARFTVAPAPKSPRLKGLHLTAFYIGDHYVSGAPRTRLDGWVYYTSKHIKVSGEYLLAHDQTSTAAPNVRSQGYSLWATPIFGHGWEALVRFDHLEPETSLNEHKDEAIAGIAYWFPVHGGVQSALLVDWDQVTFTNYAPIQPDQKKLVVHCLVNF